MIITLAVAQVHTFACAVTLPIACAIIPKSRFNLILTYDIVLASDDNIVIVTATTCSILVILLVVGIIAVVLRLVYRFRVVIKKENGKGRFIKVAAWL